MRAVVYVRVSTREQAEEGFSLAAQSKACREYAQAREWAVAEEFVDGGESARTANRPEFQRMLHLLTDDPSIEYLIVHKLDRLARNLEDHARIRAQLRTANVQLVSVSESLEESASGRLVEGILASINEFYSANLSNEIRKGMTQKVREGGWATIAPIGYRNVRGTAGGSRRAESRIEPDEQAPLVVQAFKMYATGEWSLSALHEELVSMGLKNRAGRPPVRSAIERMLKNPAYVGKVPWKGALYEGTHEPLIDAAFFDDVQRALVAARTEGDRSSKHSHYLKGVLRCGDCGSRLVYTIAKGRYPYFWCLGRPRRGLDCAQGHAPVGQVEDAIEAVYRGISVPASLRRRLEESLEREVARREAHRAEATRFAAKRLSQLANERDKVLQAYYADAVSIEVLRREQDRINTETALAEAKIDGAKVQLAETKKIIDLALSLVDNCAESYRKASPATRRLWNEAFFERIEIRDGGVSDYRLAAPFGALVSGSNKRVMVEVSGLEPKRGRVPMLRRG